MKIGVTTLYTSSIQSYGKITSEHLRLYCARHGYGFHGYTESLWKERHPAYSKLIAIKNHIACYDWLCWIDADIVIKVPYARLEPFINESYHIILSNDSYGVNTGFMFFRNSPESMSFLQAVIDYPKWNPKTCWEQDSFKAILEENPTHRSITYLAGDRFSAHWSVAKPDFALHAYGKNTAFRNRFLSAILKLHAH